MSDLYYHPEKIGYTTIGQIDWSSGDCEFNLTVVWQRADGAFFYAEDAGCSCPAPFEDTKVDDLILLPALGSLEELKAHCDARQHHNIDRSSDVVDLLERMHTAGAR